MLESDEGGIGLAYNYPVPSGQVVGDRFDVVGWPLRKAADLIKSWDFKLASLGLAALNASNNAKVLTPGTSLSEAKEKAEGDAFDFFLPLTVGKKVAVIGHFPYLHKLRDLAQVIVLERNPQPGDLPDPAAEYLLPEQDFVYITGTAFINKTITRLLELSRQAVVCLVGPSVPMNPLLFKHGVKSLSGLVAPEYEPLAEALKDPECEYIFKYGVKVNLVS
jgi:uncharacterized protein (DUF4213/DUF364 family)